MSILDGAWAEVKLSLVKQEISRFLLFLLLLYTFKRLLNYDFIIFIYNVLSVVAGQ